jgi:hypothetical protein
MLRIYWNGFSGWIGLFLMNQKMHVHRAILEDLNQRVKTVLILEAKAFGDIFD